MSTPNITLVVNMSASNLTLRLPLSVSINVSINWGDGTTRNYTTTPSYTYTNSGTYTVTITGTFNRFLITGNFTAYRSGLVSFTYNSQIANLKNFNLAFFNVTTNFTVNFNNLTNNVGPSINNLAAGWIQTFSNCTSFNSPVSSITIAPMFDQRLLGLFSGASSFNQDLSSWNTSTVSIMSSIFQNASSFNQDLSSWNTSNVADMSFMFENASSFNKDISSFNISSLRVATDMLNNSGFSNDNYNKLLIGWASQNTIQSNVPFGASTIQYTTVSALSARNTLTSNPYNWVITDGGSNIPAPTINTIDPSNGTITGGTIVTITGTNFYNGNNPLTVAFGNNLGTVNSISSDGTTINVTVPASTTGANQVDVIVTTDSGQATVTNGFTYVEIPCFLIGTNILTDKGYISIENLKKGDLIQTFKNGFVPVFLIGNKELQNNDTIKSPLYKLYKYSKDLYPELFDDLIITGGHSILVDEFASQKQQTDNDNIFGCTTPLVDGKHCLLACNNEKAVLYEKQGNFTIYHLALENENEYGEYGIFANGLLVESCNISYFKKNMVNSEIIIE